MIWADQAVSTADSIATTIIASIALVVVAAVGLLVEFIRRTLARSKETLEETNAAVHDDGGRSISVQVAEMQTQLTSLTSRVGGNEARMTDMSSRIGAVETSSAVAHRRADQITARVQRLEDETARVAREHGSRIGGVEQSVAVLQSAPCLHTEPTT